MKKQATPATDAANTTSFNDSIFNEELRFSTGCIAQIVQRRVIKHILSISDDKRTPRKWLEVAGTDAIRGISQPYKNPLEYISDFRSLNGSEYIQSIDVPEARNGGRGKSPVYYQIPLVHREVMRKLIAKRV